MCNLKLLLYVLHTNTLVILIEGNKKVGGIFVHGTLYLIRLYKAKRMENCGSYHYIIFFIIWAEFNPSCVNDRCFM